MSSHQFLYATGSFVVNVIILRNTNKSIGVIKRQGVVSFVYANYIRSLLALKRSLFVIRK